MYSSAFKRANFIKLKIIMSHIDLEKELRLKNLNNWRLCKNILLDAVQNYFQIRNSHIIIKYFPIMAIIMANAKQQALKCHL